MKAVLLVFTAVSSLVAADPELGIVQHGNSFEFSVIYSDAVSQNSMLNLENYQITPGELAGLRQTATNRGVILTVNGLQQNMPGFLSITGLVDTAQTALPPSLLPFDTGKNLWTAVGGSEIPSAFAPEVIAFSTNGFDLFSSGIQQFDEYEEVTFAGRREPGDFDYKARVAWVDPAGFGAKAGIMVREELDSGKPRPSNPEDPLQSFSRYIALTVSATQTAAGAPGNLTHQVIRRANKGDIFTELVGLTNNAQPGFPDAWLRIQRIGAEFKMFRGTNGVAWEQLGSSQFPTPATNVFFVGVAFTPQNDDLPTNLKRAYVAKFRNINATNSISLRLDIARVGDHFEVSWQGAAVLETATALNGQWGNAPSQSNPQSVDIQGPGTRYFRLRGSN